MNRPTIRFPAEWEPQGGVLLAWPHPATDWAPLLGQVIPVYRELVRQISRFEKVLIVSPDLDQVRRDLDDLHSEAIILAEAPTNDTWTRDFGPLTVYQQGRPRLLDFRFNGWGLKYPAELDNKVTAILHQQSLFAAALQPESLVLEGGSIETDGSGTLLLTSNCLLSPHRNPELERAALEARLKDLFGAKLVHWLETGHLQGDDTDSHIDTLARFAPNRTIVYQSCDDRNDSHYPVLGAMATELARLKTQAGQAYRLLPLPWPKAVYSAEGDRLPASYANYLVINQAVLLPCYADPADAIARQVLATAFPEREIISIDCRPLIEQHGSLHCISMQLPQGVLHE